MNTSINQQGLEISETLYVQPGTRRCRIFAIQGKLRPGQSPEDMLTSGARQVGHIVEGRIMQLEKKYWPTADETLLTAGTTLVVKQAAPSRTHA
jgi:hypothetical protein